MWGIIINWLRIHITFIVLLRNDRIFLFILDFFIRKLVRLVFHLKYVSFYMLSFLVLDLFWFLLGWNLFLLLDLLLWSLNLFRLSFDFLNFFLLLLGFLTLALDGALG